MIKPRSWQQYRLIAAIAATCLLLFTAQKQYVRDDTCRPDTTSHPKPHQIEHLFAEAKSRHALNIRQRSRTLQEAEHEYQRRYGIPPPEGFDGWFEYAIRHSSPIIDDFDDLMASLQPFRQFRAAACDLDHPIEAGPALLPVCIRNGTVDVGHPSKYDRKQIANPLIDLLSDFAKHLPEMCFQINTFDEPRQLIPSDKAAALIDETAPISCEDHQFEHLRYENVWSEMIAPCPEDSAARTGSSALKNPNKSLVRDWKQATELCSNAEAPPSGIIRCPANLSKTKSARPVLSAATLSSFSDIMFPTLWRWRFNIDRPQSIGFSEIDDVTPWAQKKNKVGWRGSSTGGYATGENWRQFQRHQMVALAQSPSNLSSSLDLQSPEQLRAWLDVKFTNIQGCEAETCEIIKEELLTAPGEKLRETFENKIVLDMDGHGLSGRFYMLLQSDSAVMKQGVVREWHDSRLVPWLHYIPLSMGMGELEDILQFFFGGVTTTAGDHILHSIAGEGKNG